MVGFFYAKYFNLEVNFNVLFWFGRLLHHGSDTVTPILFMGAFTGFRSNPHCKHGVLTTFYTIYSSMLKPYKNKYKYCSAVGGASCAPSARHRPRLTNVILNYVSSHPFGMLCIHLDKSKNAVIRERKFWNSDSVSSMALRHLCYWRECSPVGAITVELCSMAKCALWG